MMSVIIAFCLAALFMALILLSLGALVLLPELLLRGGSSGS